MNTHKFNSIQLQTKKNRHISNKTLNNKWQTSIQVYNKILVKIRMRFRIIKNINNNKLKNKKCRG